MGKAGAPVGNSNAAKGKLISDALRKALVQDDQARLRAGVAKLADAFADGEPWALQMVLDRLEGKAAQTLDIDGEMRQQTLVRVEFVGRERVIEHEPVRPGLASVVAIKSA